MSIEVEIEASLESRTKGISLERFAFYLLPVAIAFATGYLVLAVVLNNYQSCSASPPCLADVIFLRLGQVLPFLVIAEVTGVLLFYFLLRYLRGLKDPLEGEIKS